MLREDRGAVLTTSTHCKAPFCGSEFPPAPKARSPICSKIHAAKPPKPIHTQETRFMKHKIFALILALTVVTFAQTATQTTPSAPEQSSPEKAKPACCDKMSADSKGGHGSCMRHGHGDAKEMASCCAGKEAASCCGGKDAKSCMKDDKTAASCCKEGCGKAKMASCCDRKAAKQCGRGCCGSNKSEKQA